VSGELSAALERAIAADEHAFVDLTECEFIDVSGLTALVRADERLGQRGLRLLLYGAHGQVRRLFTLTGMIVRETFVPAGSRHARRMGTVGAPGIGS
jgi:anti-anti-sigma factor